jgi:hypothetical protein
MAAVNKYPWIKNLDGASAPLIMPGKVQAGSTATIKRGEICTYNETSGYFIAANAVADSQYSLAIANEEQKSGDLERYIEFMMIRTGDVFEFALAAAAQVELGTGYTLTASDSQKMTASTVALQVARSVSVENYKENTTTLGSLSYVSVIFNPEVSYYYKNVAFAPTPTPKILTKTAAYTIKLEDHGAVITNKGASGSVALTAPAAPYGGFTIHLLVGAAQVLSFDPKPDTASVIIKGAVQTAGKYISMTDEGDYATLVFDGTDWLAISSPSAADADITVES